jgi:type I restriction enzyme S subunit
VYNPRISNLAPFGPIRRNNLDISGVISPLYYCFRLNELSNVVFLDFYFKTDKWYKFMYQNGDTGARSDRIAIKDSVFQNLSLNIPNKNEQKKIFRLLKLLEDYITLQQEQLDLYKKLKKGLLQKLFPKDGEKIPEVRFADFTGDWKQRNLKNVISGDISDGDWIEKQHIFSKGEYRIIQTGNLSSEGKYKDKTNSAKFIRKNDFNELKANEIFPKDILISRLAAPAGRTIILPDIGHKMVTAVDITIIRPNKNFDSYYIKTLMNSNLILRRIEKKITGTTHQRISRKNLEKTILNVPSNIQEQIKMGIFFKQLDKIINLENNKLENLTFLKKYLLQKLFI